MRAGGVPFQYEKLAYLSFFDTRERVRNAALEISFLTPRIFEMHLEISTNFPNGNRVQFLMFNRFKIEFVLGTSCPSH